MPLRLSENSKNLGQIRLGVPKTMYVQLINDTDQPVQITSIKPGCNSCTVAGTNGVATVPAKGQIQLTVVFTPKSTGINRNKTVTINQETIFTFSAIVV